MLGVGLKPNVSAGRGTCGRGSHMWPVKDRWPKVPLTRTPIAGDQCLFSCRIRALSRAHMHTHMHARARTPFPTWSSCWFHQLPPHLPQPLAVRPGMAPGRRPVRTRNAARAAQKAEHALSPSANPMHTLQPPAAFDPALRATAAPAPACTAGAHLHGAAHCDGQRKAVDASGGPAVRHAGTSRIVVSVSSQGAEA